MFPRYAAPRGGFSLSYIKKFAHIKIKQYLCANFRKRILKAVIMRFDV
jgi:hypothetical protein